jgi:hypothetical protein
MDVYSVVDSVTSGTCLRSHCLAVVICVTIRREDASIYSQTSNIAVQFFTEYETHNVTNEEYGALDCDVV